MRNPVKVLYHPDMILEVKSLAGALFASTMN